MAPRVFISYRRGNGSVLARLVKESLEHGGCEVFLDVDDLGSGHFDRKLLGQIEDRPNFVLLCTNGALDRCQDEGDFLRMEIAHALKTSRNIVPLVTDGFAWPEASALPEAIRDLQRHNDILYSHRHWESTRLELLRRMKGESRPFRITLETDPARFDACKVVLEQIVADARRLRRFKHEVSVRLLEPRPTSSNAQIGLVESLRAADLLLIDVASPKREQMLYRAGIAIGLGIEFSPVTSDPPSAPVPPRPEGFPPRSAPSLVAGAPRHAFEHRVRHVGDLVCRKFE